MNLWLRFWVGFRHWTSTCVLAVVWLAVLTPVGLLSQLVRSDPLQRSFDPEAATYWEARDAEVTSSGLFAFLAERGKLWLVPVVLVLLSVGLLVVASEGSAVLVFLYPLF